ncbi:cytoplasmic dynein 2 heavy chain 1 isoform X3 [Cydia amplana]|uniref:cytoplasmic dynein 2 heavy chain 1 isoform X3 n=2 Tax=Cydia amplana TaxID=1869771 RepID=UPI002FE63A69
MMAEIKRFVTLTIEQSYNRHGLHLDSYSEEQLDNFIHNPQILLLQGSIAKGGSILLQTKVEDDKTKSVVFYKTAPEELTKEDAISNINIITLTNNAAASLYLILKQVYSPLLSTTNDLYSSKLHKNLTDLQSVLKILTYGKKDQDIIVIQSVEDEIDYWKTLAQKKDAHKKEKESASSFCELFEDISEEIQSMPSLPMLEVREAVENVGGALDDVWRITVKPYPQDRMTHIFDVIGHIICKIIEKAFANVQIWTVNGQPKDNEILTLISESLHVAETWTGACKSLTETYWPNYALHAWTGKPYVPTFCLNIQDRLKQIHEIRSTYNQLIKLLTNDERADLKTDRMFEPFQGINVWMCNGPTHAWDAAVSRFSINLRPAEANISEKLRPRLHNTSTKQMLYEFIRYKSLIDRPLVKIALNSELEIFISSLISMLKSIQAQMDSDEVDVKMYQPPEMSPVVQQVQWAKQMEAKVKDIQMCAEKYLKEFENSAELQQLSMQVLKDLKAMYTQLHEEWSRDLQAQVKNGKLQLSLDKPVVEFSAQSKMMVVNYNPRLVWAGLEARALAALGLPAPPAAAQVDAAAAALQHARALQQVASFHNTLGERMIPSTRPLMLQAALELSTLVQDQRAVYWNDEHQLRNYTDKLKSAVFQLESQNTYLTSQHIAIRGIVETLMDTELLAKQAEWKKKIKNIRDIIEAVEANGYKNTELWRSHWDWQLYKALECQYIKTLLSLHKHFPPVKVDLVLRGRTVRVQPPLEEIRVQHYHQLRRLVALPAQFVGLHTAGDSIFTAIADKHSWLGNKAVKQLEAAMSAVERTRSAWTRRAALACVPDLHAVCAEQLREPAHWEANFKACKAYGQAVAKMAFDDEKIDWIVVVTATLRHEFEAQARNLWSCLMLSLQASCRADAAELDAFMAAAALALEDKQAPKNAKELAEISAKQQAMREKMPEMEKTVENLKKKGHMLRTWGGDASVDGTIKEWQKVQELMQSRQQMFEHQAEVVKSSLSGEWENLNGGLESWASRWAQARARLDDTRGATYRDMVDRCRSVLEAHAHWLKLQADKDELLKECEKFNMAPTVSGSWEQAEKLITEDMNLWTVMKEYNEDFESIAEQDWIVFHKKLHLLDDFTSKWSSKLEPYTTVTLYLKQELDKYSDLTTLLKYVRGTDFTERHWHEVYGILEMEYKKPDSLQVKDLLSAATNIKRHIKLLQKISASASNESAIRSALNELELWFAGARLAITYYNDKAKRPVSIVKDFKEILTKIEEQQWVVSSVGADAGDACAAWDSRLRAARQLVRAASHAQRRWLYLEPILSSDEGELGIKFRKVDQGFRQATRIFEADPRLSVLLQSARLQSMLDSISEQLHACQSALKQYMDEKRSIFPRLYFLSDDDLLELLGQARAGAEGREAVMQTHLKKLFPGTSGVRLGPENMSITALRSLYGETFQLDHPVDIDCPVEVWLKNLETEMRSSLKNMTIKCVVSSSLQEQDPFSLPTQILCLAQNIRFTEQAEKAIGSKDLHKLMANIEKESAYYAATETEDESEKQKRQALLLQCAYYINVVRTLISNNVVATSDWLWQKQLRFYIQSSKDVIAKMGLAQISYSYEYLGINTGQFVRTELADECFLILTQSLHLGLMGNPFGPAGTGKTESVKALGGLVGRLVLVFNCDEAMDTECMGRLLSGLALCGAWGCFDEFNRLTADTLANISHQLASLLTAMRENTGQATALLNGKHVTVSQWCGVAATMNPVGRGYGGRRALPADLERVLRPVAMVEPRGDQLARHLLAAQCVTDAEALAEDLYAVFSMASTLLGGQRHYDWGLRALKAAVGSAGAALAARDLALRPRRAALRRVLRRNNMSKLTAQDKGRFENILSLVFADVPHEEHATDPICSALDASVVSLGLVHNKLQVQKCVDLYEQMQQRMGVVIVGPPGCGKSAIRKLLKTALVQQGRNIVEYRISPKAMSRSWLLGHIDPDTRQWSDGVISATALQVSNQPAEVWSWVVMDGDVDPSWVEALNSVLDDNRLLTLPSGWRIQFGANVNFLFETDSLDHASPATLSRMGVILMSEESSCAEDVMENWMRKAEFDNELAKMALSLLQQAVKKCIHWLNTHKSDVVIKIYNLSVVKHILTQFEYIAQNELTGVNKTPEELVYLALERSVASIIKPNAIDKFHEEMSDVLGPPLSYPVLPGGWVTEALCLSPRLAAVEPTVRACFASDDSHLLIIGPDACAKNLLAEYVAKESNGTVITIDCTPILEPTDIIAELKRNNVVGSGGRGGGSRFTLLVRSLHRASVDEWGSSAVCSFLLQLINWSGFWSLGPEEGPQWAHTARARVLATAAAPPRPRLHAGLQCVLLPEPDDDEMLELARVYLRQSTDKNISDTDISGLASSVLSMFKEVTETFQSKLHYYWNASHFKQWCENIQWYSPSNVAELITAIVAEANSIFKDRLITEEEKATYNSISRRFFKGTYNEGVLFATKLRNDGVYMEAVDHREWYHTTQKYINQCLSEREQSVFGEDGAEVCLELATLCPAFARATSGGVVVCVCSAGAGRRAAAHVAAAALPAALLTVHHHLDFNKHLKNALSSSSEGSRTLVLVRESTVNHTTLATIEALRRAQSTHCIPAHIMPSLNNTQQTQVLQNIKQNLGIVICLDKDQDDLFELMERFPLLYKDSHLIWIERWCGDTLAQMPQLVIQRLIKENLSDSSKEQHEAIPVEGFVSIYSSLDVEWMKAPCRYIGFIKTYFYIVSKKKEALVQRKNMLSAGVEALKRARSEVATLQAEAAQQEAALSEKQAAANQALDQIGATVRATTDKKEEMHELKQSIEQENAKLQIRKQEIEKELASVEPVIAAARAAVGDIRPESLSEIRSLRAPPDVVRDVLEGVLRLMGIADTSWHSMKNFLSKRGVKEDIRCLDARQISPAAAASVARLLERRGASFQPAAARRASAAAAPLAAWVQANLAYAAALDKVQPLQLQQAQLHRNLQEAEGQLAALSSGLATVDERVSALKEQLGRHTRDAAALELRLNTAQATIRAARALLDQLRHEYAAWETDLEYISKEISEIDLRSLLAAAYIIYLPDVTEPKAMEYISKWSLLLGFEDQSFSPINFLASTEKQLKWDADGLPSDTSAVKNAVIIDQYLESNKCGFMPLIIDPDGEAIAWLKSTLADVACDFVAQDSDQLQTALQYAVRLGRTLVITEVTAVRPSWLAGLGGRVVLLGRDAALAARLPPHQRARLARLLFTARRAGLTDQLIHYALQQQNPQINEKMKEIKLKKAIMQKQQHELQENLLKDLSANGDILHDSNLLASLNKTRATSATIAEALEAARAIEDETQAASRAFAPSASRAANVALAVKELAARRPLLALHVDAVLPLYGAALAGGDTKTVNDDEVIKYLMRRVVERVLLSLHKRDKYIVVLHLLRQVYDHLIPEKLWQMFIGSSGFVEDVTVVNEIKKIYPWIQSEYVKKIVQLKMTDEELFNKMCLNDEAVWKRFQSSGDVADISKLNLTEFEVVLAVALLRPESLYRAIVTFVDQLLGTGVMSGGDTVGRAARWGGARPVLLLGAHAADVLAAHAPHLTQVGIEEGRAAWEAGAAAARNGWLALVVGASPFTPELQAFLDARARAPVEESNPDFRLWIVSEDREIPPVIANACVNVIIEAPEGVKSNVLNTLSAWAQYSGDVRVVRAHACLALLHAIVQERRAYIPQGWSRWYAWEWGEVRACTLALRSGCAPGCARALVGALYGARAAAAPDRALLRALLRACLAEPASAHGWPGPAPHHAPLRLPFTTELQAYSSAFNELPDIDSPQLLGLPANCRLAWEKNAAEDIIAGLKELNSTVVTSRQRGDSTALKSLLALWKKLMSGNPLLKGDYQPEQESGGWWGAVVGGEAREAAHAARALHAALGKLARKQHAHHALLRTPEEWQLLWSGPEAPEAYLKEFCHRALAAARNLAPLHDDYMPKEVDLRCFLRPERVLCAVRARAASRLAHASHKLTLQAVWDPAEGGDGDGDSALGVVGLRLTGARWDAAARALRPCTAACAPHRPAPRLLLRLDRESALCSETWFEIPVYNNEAREQVILTARAPLHHTLSRDAALLNAAALYVAQAD